MLISDIISKIEEYAPLALQEDYDNSGVQVGRIDVECKGVLLCLDITPAIIDEAINRNCNLVISHHPLLFKGLKRITGSSNVEKSVIKAISSDITIYSNHTSMDNATNGVSWLMGKNLGLQNLSVLDKQEGKLFKLATMVPVSHVDVVKQALASAGAGKIGNYDSCSFTSEGQGCFRPLSGANPFVGSLSQLHTEQEAKIEVVLPYWHKTKIERALIDAHPYEEPAYEFYALENNMPYNGSGIIGTFEKSMDAYHLVEHVKKTFSSPIVRCSKLSHKPISKIALCGGSGSFLIKKAISAGADAFITSDTKYHDFIDYADDIFIIDIGHYESENCTKDIFYHIIRENFSNFALYYSELEQNPIIYL